MSQNTISAVTASNGTRYIIDDVSKSAVSVDNIKADVNMVHISLDDYNERLVGGEILSNELYVISSDYVETYGQQIKNLAPGTELSDAVNFEQLSEVSARAADTYTKTETDQKIADAQYFKKYVVESLPPLTAADDRGIYLVPSTDSELSNVYDEYVTVGEGAQKAWEKIGAKNIDLSGYKTKQTAKTSPAASSTTTSFIDTITQNENGEITATKKNIQTASTTHYGIVQLNNTLTSTSTSEAATANAVKLTNDKFADYSLTSHVHDQYLSAVPSDYKTYAQTTQSLSGDGYATLEQLASVSSDLRYSFSSPTVPSGATPSISGLVDRAMNSVVLGSSVISASIALPAATSGRARDFFIDLDVQAAAAPSPLQFNDPATSAVANIKFGSDSLDAIAPGYNLVLFTEIAPNKFLVSVKHEDVT